MEHKELVKKAIEAINDVFTDNSVSPEETVESLRSLKAEVQLLIETMQA